MITVPVCRKFIGTLSYGNICLNRVGKRFTYAFHRTNICAGAVNDALGEHSELYGDVMPAQNCQSALAEHARVHLAHAHMRIQERAAFPTILSAAMPPRKSSPLSIRSRSGRTPREVLVNSFLPLAIAQVKPSFSTISRSDCKSYMIRTSDSFDYAPNKDFAARMFSVILTPNGQRFSHAPQAIQSPALALRAA